MRTSLTIILILISLTAQAGLFDAKRYGVVELKELVSGIESNDAKPLKQLIKDKPNIFDYGSYEKDSSKIALWLVTNDSAMDSVLSYGSQKIQNICRPELVKLLLADGVQPSESFSGKGSENNGHLSGAIKASCKDSFDILIEKSTATDIAIASKQISFTSISKIKNDPALAPNAAAIVQSLIVANQKNCKANVSASCDSEKYLRSVVAEFKDNEEAIMHSQTPAGQAEDLTSEICEAIAESNDLETALKEEKAKSKISGVSNLLILKNTGDQIFEAKKVISSKSADYKKLTKKSFNKKSCK